MIITNGTCRSRIWVDRKRGRMIEDKNFNIYMIMKSGIKYMFKVSETELDWLFDKMFERTYEEVKK